MGTFKRCVNRLSKCIKGDLPTSDRCAERKEKGLELFSPQRSRSYEMFNSRPLPNEMRLCVIQDVQFMPKL